VTTQRKWELPHPFRRQGALKPETKDAPALRETQSISALLLTRGRFNYRRDVLALLSLPTGARHYVQWGHAWIDPRKAKGLRGKSVLYCLFFDHSGDVMPLRVVRVRDVDTTDYENDPENPLLSRGFTRMELEALDWPVGPEGKHLRWERKNRSGSPEHQADPCVCNPAAQLELNEVGLPENFIYHFGGSIQVGVSARVGPWVSMVKALKDDEEHAGGGYVTVTSVKRARVGGSTIVALRDSRQLRDVAVDGHGKRARIARMLSTHATNTKGRYVLRSGRVYRLRVMYYAEESEESGVRYGILNTDSVISAATPPQPMLTGEFEIMDLPVTVRVTRRRHGTLVLGPRYVEGDLAVDRLPVPEVPVPVDLRPRRSFFVVSMVAAILAVGAIIIAALTGNGSVHDALLVFGTTTFAALIVYLLRPED
jgi:hypothetical protein